MICSFSSLGRAWSRKGADLTLWLDMLTSDLYFLENVGRLVTPAKKLEDTIRLAELVIEVLQQNEEHHAEVSAPICTPGYPYVLGTNLVPGLSFHEALGGVTTPGL